eukprot:gnl/TRDRNA2_/TRDRNA2_206921_c0_seq1.p1 gnl/TRDRNA2_/TRDRNA2_206921_c0~~gnl/TRDRNA2_/TRDRNA2_206921_c0_seq1.p1  ORF type:complete len:389 (-),score=47.99 gnl/TRDRNA2_/TRDRNA2_206921_c0_seq1:20-1147(-)
MAAANGLEDVELQLLGGRTIRGLRCGSKGGDPWLFLHGWLDNAAAFIPMLPIFRETIDSVELVAIDMAGHGHSDHRPGGYVLVDYAADALLVADALGWANFSIVGHSLGGYAAGIAAGTQPERVTRLVMLDIIGPTGRQAIDAPAVLAKSVSWIAERSAGGAKAGGSRLKVFPTVEEAAKQRSEKNIGGPMTLSNAMLIASRGVVSSQADSAQGFVWASDPRVLAPPTQEITPEVAASFLSSIRCPTLVLLTSDGIYRHLLRAGSRWSRPVGGSGLTLTHALGRPFCGWLFVLWILLRATSRLLSLLPIPARRQAIDAFSYRVREGWRLGCRLRAIRDLRYEEMATGGHHFHMTVPVEATRVITEWLKTVKSRAV